MELTLKQCCEIMKEINKSKDFECFFENGKMVIQSKIITIYNGN